MKLRDRVSGTLREPSGPVLLGQWLVESGDNLGCSLNGSVVEDGDVLVPDPMGRWTLADDSASAKGRFFPDAMLEDQDAEALLQIGSLLRESPKAEAGWQEWCMTSPLAPGLDKAVKENPLEDKIEDELHHLEEVCRKPRTHIRLETERTLVARARRIDPRAPAWLAAHTEDWEHRRIVGIQPSRILAHVREEDWNLYENRVAARLVDHLATWLRRRIGEVRRVLNDIFVRLAEYQVSAEGSRHRMRRIFDLWGEAWEASHGKDAAERTLRRLERLLYRILGLMHSPLYRNVPREAQVPRSLRSTNLMVNDTNYRGVGRLWHCWSKLAPGAMSPAQLYRRHQAVQRAFGAWCMLVLVRASQQLGLDAVDEDLEVPIRPGCCVRLASGHRIEWMMDGTVGIADHTNTVVRFVPLAHPIELAPEREALAARVAPLVESAAGNAGWTVVLHPAVPGTPRHVPLSSVGDPPAPSTSGTIDFVRVSPFSLESVERVARAVRWATLAPRMLAYPPAVRTPPKEIRDAIGPWLQQRGSTTWNIVRPLRQEERARLALERQVAAARANRDDLAAQRQAADDELRRVRGDRRGMAELNRQKRELLAPLQEAEDLVRRLEEFGEDLARAERDLAGIMVCPVCHASAEFTPRAEGCFVTRCRADGCETTWELRGDPPTGERIPVLLPGGVRATKWPRAAAPQWVDEVLGCDVLAIPVVEDDGTIAFRPPRTTATTFAEAVTGSAVTTIDGTPSPELGAASPRPLERRERGRL